MKGLYFKKNKNKIGGVNIKDLIMKFLEEHPEKSYSIGALAKRLDTNIITMTQHLRELAERGDIEGKEAEILLLKGKEAEILLLKQEKNKIVDKLQKIKLYTIKNGKEEEKNGPG